MKAPPIQNNSPAIGLYMSLFLVLRISQSLKPLLTSSSSDDRCSPQPPQAANRCIVLAVSSPLKGDSSKQQLARFVSISQQAHGSDLLPRRRKSGSETEKSVLIIKRLSGCKSCSLGCEGHVASLDLNSFTL